MKTKQVTPVWKLQWGVLESLVKALCKGGSQACNIGYPSENQLKLTSREISFVQNNKFNCQIFLKFCTKRDSATAVRYAKFQTDLTNKQRVLSKRDFMN